MVPHFVLSQEQPLTVELIRKIINLHQGGAVPRYNKLEKYYLGQNQIYSKIQTDESLPNNKVGHPYGKLITDELTGYFMGEGVTYTSEDQAAIDELTPILQYNDEQDQNTELAKDASIFGEGLELQYIDKDGMNRLKRIDPREGIIIKDDTLDENILYFIRYYPIKDLLTDRKSWNIDVYSRIEIIHYTSDELFGAVTEVGREPHYFGMVPVAEFQNNEEEVGDFEPVISLIDAYDKMESNSLDDFDYFVDAYLVLTGLNADKDDIAEMKKNRVILLDQDSDAQWLTKDANVSESTQTIKTRLDKDIHKFAAVPDMSDENFAGNASGVAIKYKTMNMENVVSIKERKFKKGLQERLEILFNILALKGSVYDFRSINMTFARNLPSNEAEVAQMVSTLQGIVSDETLLAQIPFVEDPQKEAEKVKEQKEENVEQFYNNSSFVDGSSNPSKEDSASDNGDEKEQA